jgi:hypothetical protein
MNVSLDRLNGCKVTRTDSLHTELELLWHQRWNNVSLAQFNRCKVKRTGFYSLHTELELFWLQPSGPVMEQRLSCSTQWMKSDKTRFLLSTHWPRAILITKTTSLLQDVPENSTTQPGWRRTHPAGYGKMIAPYSPGICSLSYRSFRR